MSKREVLKLFEFKTGQYEVCGLNLIQKLWWRFMPGVIVNVAWPNGRIVVDDTMPGWDWTMGATLQEYWSADPNDHYRPFLEKNVGRQGWDWQWGFANNDVAENRLTIKIREKHASMATLIALSWT